MRDGEVTKAKVKEDREGEEAIARKGQQELSGESLPSESVFHLSKEEIEESYRSVNHWHWRRSCLSLCCCKEVILSYTRKAVF